MSPNTIREKRRAERIRRRRMQRIAIIAILLIFLFGVGYLVYAGVASRAQQATPTPGAATPTSGTQSAAPAAAAGVVPTPGPNATVTPDGLQIYIQQEGTGTAAKTGDTVTVNYTGRLVNGTVFDSSEGKPPFSFTLGVGQVIPGWDEGLQGMKVGGKRQLVIPPDLAYGSSSVGSIPANSTLIFDVELVDVKTPAQ